MSNNLKEAADTVVKDSTRALAGNSLSNESQDIWKSLAGTGSEMLKDGILLGRGFMDSDKFDDFLKQAKIEQNAKNAADIIDRRGDMGTDYQKAQLEKMFEEAKRNGTTQQLADAINAELEKRNCHCRVKVGGVFDLENPQPISNRGTTISLVDSDHPAMVIDNFVVSNNQGNTLKYKPSILG